MTKQTTVVVIDSLRVKVSIALDKMLFFNPEVLISFLFLQENICCGFSLEASWPGASNE